MAAQWMDFPVSFKMSSLRYIRGVTHCAPLRAQVGGSSSNTAARRAAGRPSCSCQVRAWIGAVQRLSHLRAFARPFPQSHHQLHHGIASSSSSPLSYPRCQLKTLILPVPAPSTRGHYARNTRQHVTMSRSTAAGGPSAGSSSCGPQCAPSSSTRSAGGGMRSRGFILATRHTS